MPSVELRFVELFSRADTAVYRGGVCGAASSRLPCIVDSGPWPDGTYDVRVRADAWHGHLAARAAAITEEPMTQLQDLELAETQATDDAAAPPVQTAVFHSMLPPPPPPQPLKKTSISASVSEAAAPYGTRFCDPHSPEKQSDVVKRQRENAEVDKSCAKRVRCDDRPVVVSDDAGIAIEGVSSRQDVQMCGEPVPDASTPQRSGAFAASGCQMGSSPSSTEKTVAPALPASQYVSEGGCASSLALKEDPIKTSSREDEAPQFRSSSSVQECGRSAGSSGRDSKPPPADFFVEPVAEPSAKLHEEPPAVSLARPVARPFAQPLEQPLAEKPARAQANPLPQWPPVVRPATQTFVQPPAVLPMQALGQQCAEQMGVTEESAAAADHAFAVGGVGIAAVTPWNCEVRSRDVCYHMEGEEEGAENSENHENKKEDVCMGDKVGCPCPAMDLSGTVVDNGDGNGDVEHEAGSILVSGSDSGWGSQLDSQGPQDKNEESAHDIVEQTDFAAEDYDFRRRAHDIVEQKDFAEGVRTTFRAEGFHELDNRWRKMTRVWSWKDGYLESQAVWSASDDE